MFRINDLENKTFQICAEPWKSQKAFKNEIKVIAHFAFWHLLLWNNIKISVISDMIDENQLKIFSMYANTDLQVCNWNPCFLCALRVLGFTVRVLGFCWAQCLLNDRFKFAPRIQYSCLFPSVFFCVISLTSFHSNSCLLICSTFLLSIFIC